MRFNSLFNVLLVLWPLSSLNVYAEGNCPSGYYPIGGGATAGCAPIPGNGNGNGSASSGGVPDWQSFSDPAPVWQNRWGAVAGDKQKSILGAVTGLPSESAAQQAAMADCAAKGGIQCKVENSYVNGCMAMIVGDWGYNISSRATLDEATASGMQECQKKDKNCKTFYGACSPPVRIR